MFSRILLPLDRSALARVMLQTPQLIIFDEATSVLDNTNEAIIQHNIERIFKQKTIITIAHRLSTLKNADRILVFDAGRIVQEGDGQVHSGVATLGRGGFLHEQ